MSEPDDLFETRDKLIAKLRQQVDEFESLPKEWEGSGYNPQQMARLVKEYRGLQKQLAECKESRDSHMEAFENVGQRAEQAKRERDLARAKCAEMLKATSEFESWWVRGNWDDQRIPVYNLFKFLTDNPGQSLLDERDALRERVKVLEILRALSEESLPLFQHLANKLITGDMAQVEADRLLMELDDALSAAKSQAEASARRPEALADGPEGKQEVKS
jgi:signal recognition particle GTPase